MLVQTKGSNLWALQERVAHRDVLVKPESLELQELREFLAIPVLLAHPPT